MKDRQATAIFGFQQGMVSRRVRFAGIAVQFFLLVGCVGPHRSQQPAIIVTNPISSASALSWHSGVGPDNNPPTDCADTPRAPAGSKSLGSVKGSAPDTVAYRAAHSVDDPTLEIDDNNLKSFEGPVTYALIPNDSVIYRVIGKGGDPIGHWWTNYPPPPREAEWRSELAVLAQWNGASCVEKFKVTKKQFAVWLGLVAPQSDGARGWYLKGGGLQIFVPSPKDEIEKQRIEYAHVPWAP